mmetsp:Transcript_72016/g.223580  ORF Transcript_72016/g.223580 Transcript_72016/m.223580 type:complete len:247 (+) Transcript_72016:1083-1823(+)
MALSPRSRLLLLEVVAVRASRTSSPTGSSGGRGPLARCREIVVLRPPSIGCARSSGRVRAVEVVAGLRLGRLGAGKEGVDVRSRVLRTLRADAGALLGAVATAAPAPSRGPAPPADAAEEARASARVLGCSAGRCRIRGGPAPRPGRSRRVLVARLRRGAGEHLPGQGLEAPQLQGLQPEAVDELPAGVGVLQDLPHVDGAAAPAEGLGLRPSVAQLRPLQEACEACYLRHGTRRGSRPAECCTFA